MRRSSKVWLAAPLAAALAGWSGGLSAHGAITNVTWVNDIGPLVQRRCSGCHGPGGVARLSLSDFEQVSQAAARVKTEVLTHRMPPWHAAPGFGDFANDQSLTPHEIQLLVSWADGGKPRGINPAIAAAPTPAPAAAPAPSAAPDLVLDAGQDTPVRSRRQRYVLRTREKTDKWIHAWRFTPGNQKLIKQARVSIENGETLGVWVPPGQEVVMPSGVAQRLRVGASLTLEIEYAKPDESATDRSSVALFFGAEPARELRQMVLARGTATLAEGLELLALRPQLEASGESIRIVAERPDGSSEALLWLRTYDEGHQLTYRFRRPVTLPAGTKVHVFAFDATAAAHLEYVRQ
jgi:hypothetical protein